MTPTSGNPPSGGEEGPEPQTRNPAGAAQETPYTPASTTVALSQQALCCDHRQNPPVPQLDMAQSGVTWERSGAGFYPYGAGFGIVPRHEAPPLNSGASGREG